jgi:hypothetical protein
MKVINTVVPAKAGTHFRWIPAFAGMASLSTEFPWAFGRPEEMRILPVTPAQAGVHVPNEVDSRFRGNDVTFGGAVLIADGPSPEGFGPQGG